MRSLLGRFHRPMSRGLVNNMLTMNNLGDGSTLSLDFTTMGGVLDPRLTFSRAGGGTYVGPDGYIYGVDSATSASLAIGTGSKSVTLTATAGVDRRFQVGQTVYFSSGANNMNGLVTAYDALTQVITINATATTGSGSFTSWFVGNASPRFDYSPTNIGEPRGLLIEGQAINFMTYSEDQGNNSTWNAYSTSVTRTTGQTDPENTTTATKILFDATSADAVISRSVTISNATAYTISVWMRADSGTVSNVRFGRAAAASGAIFPTLTTTWQRVQLAFTSSGTSDGIEIRVLTSGSPKTATIHIWGAQLELGSGASSYIPTGASQVTRNADKMSMADISTMQWNQTAGTFSLHMDVSAETNTSSFPTFMGMYTATPVRVVRFRLNNSSGTNPRIGNDIWTSTPSVIVDNLSNTRPVAPTAFKFAVSLSNTGQTMNQIINGGTVVTTSGTGTMETPTKLLWNTDPSAGDTEYFPIHMRSLKYYPTALTAAQLQTLTAP